MDEKYIQINSIKDIDVTKVRPQDLKKRYIDPQGNRYAIKFDIKTRNVKIVQIIKGIGEIQAVRDRMARQKTGGTQPLRARRTGGDLEARDEGESDEENEVAKKDKPLTRDEVAEYVSKNFVKTKDRLKAVLNHLRKSNYFDKDPDPRSKNYVLDMARVMDNECIKRIEQSVSLIIELKKFPRPIGYYINKMDPVKKEIFEKIDNDEKKMEMVKDWELQGSFVSTVDVNIEVLQKILKKINEPRKSVYGQLSYSQKQNIRDAKLSAEYAVTELNKIKKKILAWKAVSVQK
jgi:hypothetical protein